MMMDNSKYYTFPTLAKPSWEKCTHVCSGSSDKMYENVAMFMDLLVVVSKRIAASLLFSTGWLYLIKKQVLRNKSKCSYPLK